MKLFVLEDDAAIGMGLPILLKMKDMMLLLQKTLNQLMRF